MASSGYIEFFSRVLEVSELTAIDVADPVVSYNLGAEDGYTAHLSPTGMTDIPATATSFAGQMTGYTLEAYDITDSSVMLWFRVN